MKRILSLLLMGGFLVLSAQTGKSAVSEKYKNLKKLKSVEEEEVKIEISKPDNDALMPRTETEIGIENSLNLIERLKKSNKLLY
jgi:hypothetical protein